MSPPTIGAIGIAALFALLFLRVPVWCALALVGFFGTAAISGFQSALTIAGTTPFDTSSAYTLSVIPLFITMGNIASRTRLSTELFQAARVALSGMRGGLSLAAIAASACFGALCGSSVATAATISKIALPEMREAGYDDRLSTGALAAGGSIGILVPPSIILVIYAAIAEQSVPKLFAATLFPGLLLTALYMLAAVAMVHLRPHYAPEPVRLPLKDKIAALFKPWQFLTLFLITIGGIYAGIFSPTEAAAIGASGAIILGFAAGRLSLKAMFTTIEQSIVTSCLLFAIIIGANLLSTFMVQTHLPELLVAGARSLNLPPLGVMALIIAAYIVMGCFLEGIGMMLITVPVFLPVVKQFGYDPLWFAMIVVIVIEVGLIHPPVGMNLFVIQAQAPDVRITSIYTGVLPFLLAPLVLIVLLFVFPNIALWLPHQLYR